MGRALLLAALLPLAAGCTFLGDVTAIGVGAGAGAATGNPAVAIAVGIGARSALRELSSYVERQRHAGEQDAIATAAGTVPVGGTAAWEIRHTLPYGNHHGTLAVAREFATPLATCRTVVFQVAEEEDRSIFATSLCRGLAGGLAGGGAGTGPWRWAAAEPAVARWGTFQ